MKRYSSLSLLLIILTLNSAGCDRAPSPLDIPSGVTYLSDLTADLEGGPVWSPSGKQVALSGAFYTRAESTIYLLEVGNPSASRSMEVDGLVTVQAWSPDGSKLALAGRMGNGQGVWVINLGDRAISYLGPGTAATWFPDGKRMAVFSCENDLGRLDWLDLSTKVRTRVYSSNSCVNPSELDLSADGRTLAFTGGDESQNSEQFNPAYPDQIYLLDISTGKTTALTEKGSWSPSWAPDSHSLAFIRNLNLIISDRNGSCAKRVENLLSAYNRVAWSPDGTQLAVSAING